MITLKVRNVHDALPVGLHTLIQRGKTRDSRNGAVIQMPTPVSTVYERPEEAIVHWQVRDYNTAFSVYEALWMLSGRRDVSPLCRYVADFHKFSDDGSVLHGAYGWRWLNHFRVNQLKVIISILKTNPLDRRCVLQMWDANADLGADGKDVPCNDMATFQVGTDGRLHMVVFCRSNDVIWGAYYANAYHFGMLLRYVAHQTGLPLGTYTQVSVNYHAYLSTLEPLRGLAEIAVLHDLTPTPLWNPYKTGAVRHDSFVTLNLDRDIQTLITAADNGFPNGRPEIPGAGFFDSAFRVLYAHKLLKDNRSSESFRRALIALAGGHQKSDLIYSMATWVKVREERWRQRTAKNA